MRQCVRCAKKIEAFELILKNCIIQVILRSECFKIISEHLWNMLRVRFGFFEFILKGRSQELDVKKPDINGPDLAAGFLNFQRILQFLIKLKFFAVNGNITPIGYVRPPVLQPITRGVILPN
jgi:hypothetical protein